MSHYSSKKTEIRNPYVLKSALEARGYKNVEIHEEPAELFGYQKGFSANVIVRQADAKARWGDIGWKLQSDGTYSFLYDDYDRNCFNEHWQNAVNQEYAAQIILETQMAEGYEMLGEREYLPDGTIRIVMQQATMY